MKTCRWYIWVAWVSVGLALALSSCVAQDVKTEPPATSVPQTQAQPVTPQPALRVGIAPNYPPIAFKQEGHLTGLEVDFARDLETELGRRVELVELDWEALIPSLESGKIDVITHVSRISKCSSENCPK
jgi:ABC-type amino acid transport substrate-binding protein